MKRKVYTVNGKSHEVFIESGKEADESAIFGILLVAIIFLISSVYNNIVYLCNIPSEDNITSPMYIERLTKSVDAYLTDIETASITRKLNEKSINDYKINMSPHIDEDDILYKGDFKFEVLSCISGKISKEGSKIYDRYEKYYSCIVRLESRELLLFSFKRWTIEKKEVIEKEEYLDKAVQFKKSRDEKTDSQTEELQSIVQEYKEENTSK